MPSSSDFKVGLGICTHRDLRMKAHQGLRQLYKCPNPEIIEISVDQDALISRSRSRVVTHFLEKTDYDVLLFLDDDVVINTVDATKLAWLCYKQYPIVGGIYVTKSQENPGLAATPWDESGTVVFGKDGGMMRMRDLATGCLAIRRSVLEDMVAKAEKIGVHHCVHADYKYWSVFQQQDTWRGEWHDTSEDYFFCKNAIELGYELYADTSIILGHIGNYEFTPHDLVNFPNRVKAQNIVLRYGQKDLVAQNGLKVVKGEQNG